MSTVNMPTMVEIVTYQCDRCYFGNMRLKPSDEVGQPDVQRQGVSKMPQIEHFCPECGTTKMLPEHYPYILVTPVVPENEPYANLRNLPSKKIFYRDLTDQ